MIEEGQIITVGSDKEIFIYLTLCMYHFDVSKYWLEGIYSNGGTFRKWVPLADISLVGKSKISLEAIFERKTK